jgi:hypothetical protein
MAVSEEIQKQLLAEATSATPNFETDYTDERFDKVNQEHEADMNKLQQTVGGMIGQTDKFYEDLKNQSQEWADKQAQIQQENTDFAIEKIEQQKEKAQSDYLKEQSGAYADWRKQSNQYGVEAEKMASSGLANTGFSESSQVGMYNTYQIRVATARQVMAEAKLNYDNGIKEAMLQNNAALAEIYANAYQKQLELALQGFQYKNQLILDLADREQKLKDNKWQKELAIIQQQNTENQMAWDAWKYEDNKAWQTEQAELDRQWQREKQKIDQDFQEKMAKVNHDYDIKLLNAKTAAEKKAAEEEHKREMEKLQKTYELDLANKKALYDHEHKSSGVGITGSTGSYTGGVSSYDKSTRNKAQNMNTGSTSISKYMTPAVNTAYYQGAKNKDANIYGTFDNGYQPKGITGHGKITKTGDTITFKTQTLSGQKQTVTQNIWKAADGTKWYWEGRQNKYIQVK